MVTTVRIIFMLIAAMAVLTGFAAEAQTVSIKGKVTESGTGKPLEYAHVELRTHNGQQFVDGCMTDADGLFRLTAPSRGTYRLKASFMGYSPAEQDIDVDNTRNFYSLSLGTDGMQLDEVVVKGLTQAEKVQRLAYNVSLLETESLAGTTFDLSGALDRINGVRIRQDGGLGSETNVTLNGFSGRHVKVFIDGVPMDGMSSAFGLNNIPVSLARRIEVYKGVVPIELGGDALGGAINIVTDDSRRSTRVNASYSYGSFNTHKSNVYAEWTSPKGFYASLNAYQNYSDNDYDVNVNTITHYYDNGSSRVEEGDFTVRRFHARYHNEAAVLKLGIVGKRFADRLLVGFVGGYEYKQLQNGSSMSFVYGQRYNTATTLMPSLTYDKRFDVLKGLKVSLNGNFNFGQSYAADTAARKYNWLGEWKPMPSKGESSYMRYRYRDNNGAVNLHASLFPARNHAVSLSSTLTTFSRKGKDETTLPYGEDDYPKESMKVVTGLSYKYDYRNVWNTSVFIKNYVNYLSAYVDPDGEFGPLTTQFFSNTHSYWGGGLATTWFAGSHVQLKASYEYAYRLPTSNEMFGSADGIEVGQADLKPEKSNNVNAGITAIPVDNGLHRLTVDVAFQYRNVEDYIRREVSMQKGTATSTNDGRVRNLGADAGARYEFKDLLRIGGNFSYNDMRNMSLYQAGTLLESTVYKDRIPNQPYLYGNAEAGITLHNLLIKGSVLDISYALTYVHRFSYEYESYNNTEYDIPRQLSHDIFVSYNFGKRNEFTVSAECRNLFNERLYDNFRMQKPGRSFAVKIGYSFMK